MSWASAGRLIPKALLDFVTEFKDKIKLECIFINFFNAQREFLYAISPYIDKYLDELSIAYTSQHNG